MGRLLQAARKSAGMTQQDLCHKAGLSYSTLTKIERGAIKAPSVFTILSISGALGVGIDSLLAPALPTDKPKKHSKSGVSFVYFDVNGCLVRFYEQAFTRLSEVSGLSCDVIETAFWHYNDRACRGEMTMDEFDEKISKALGVQKIDWLSHYLKAIEPIKEMHDLLRWASQNYRVGLLTNIMPGFVNAMRKQGFIPDISYDAIVDSSIEGTIKPESRIYEIATERARCSASEIMLIDDTNINMMAAEKQGWHVLQFSDYALDQSINRIKAALD